ncbi:MAG TPA: hypothetical protein VGC74_14240 [Stenotrophomonas sp.]
MPRTLLASRLPPSCFLLMVGLLWMGGCRREPPELPGAAAEPATTVRQLVNHLQANDLVGFAKASVTAQQYAELESAWRQGRSRWPLTTLPLGGELPRLLQALSEPGAEQRLQRAFDTQIAGQGTGIKQAAHSLGLFGVQYLRNQGDYTPEQRTHYVKLVTALSDWIGNAPLADRPHAQAAIPRLVAAARRTGLRNDADLQAAGMEESLRRLGPFVQELKAVLETYGLALDTSLAETRVGLVSQQGDRAKVHIQYPLAAEQIDTSADLVRVQGHWYLASVQREVTALLQSSAEVDAASAAAAATPVPGESTQVPGGQAGLPQPPKP